MENDGAAIETMTFQKRASAACEIIGYTAQSAWLPVVLLFGTPWTEEVSFNVFDSLVIDGTRIAAGIVCLAVCCLCGFVFAAISNMIASPQRLVTLWIVSVACTAASLVVPHGIAGIVLMSIAFSIVHLLWKLHVLNKAIDGGIMLISTAACGFLLILSSTIAPAAMAFSAPILVLVSCFAFIAVSVKTFANWVFIPREAMRDEGIDNGRKLLAFVARSTAGFGIGTIAFALSPSPSIAAGGAAWILGAIVVLAISHARGLKKLFPKGVRRAVYAVVVLAAFAFFLALPLAGQVIAATIMLAASIALALSNAIDHYAVKKDDYLSDVFLAGSRQGTDSAGMLIGFAAGFIALSVLPAWPAISIATFATMECLVVFAVLRSIHAFSDKGERIRKTPLSDPWHAKMLTVARNSSLTPRQTQIFDALSRGRNAKYIMERLYLSEGTVKKQIFQIYKKLDVHTQQDLITLVLGTDADPSIASKCTDSKAYGAGAGDKA